MTAAYPGLVIVLTLPYLIGRPKGFGSDERSMEVAS